MVIVEKRVYESLKTFTGLFFVKNENIFKETIISKKVFIKNDNFHRYYGPSYIVCRKYNNIKNKYWDFNKKEYGCSENGYNQKQFLKDLNKQWLS